MCQPMPPGIYTRYEFDADLQGFKPRQNESRNSENVMMSYFQQRRTDRKIETFYTSGTQKKVNCFNADEFCRHCIFSVSGNG